MLEKKRFILCFVNSLSVGNQSEKNYLRLERLVLRCALRLLRVFFALRFPPLKTVTGGTTTPVWGSFVNWRTISILDAYLLRVALRPFRETFLDFRILRVRFFPPFNGIGVGHPIPPGKLHQT